jgi:hypothetical protein
MTRQERVDELVDKINDLITTLEYTLDDRVNQALLIVLGQEVEDFDSSRIKKLDPYKVRVK